MSGLISGGRLAKNPHMPGTAPQIIRPFRWNVARRNELGSLVSGPLPRTYPGFTDGLRRCTALALARSGGGTLVFVGRSLELCFDYLSGLTAGLDTRSAPPLKLLQVSLGSVRDIAREAQAMPAETASLLGYMRSEGLGAADIEANERGVTFIDVVSSGATFGVLTRLLHLSARTDGIDWHAIERRIGFVGVVEAGKNSPNAWRWWQHEPWVATLKKPRISNVSVHGWLWGFLANNDIKTTLSHGPWRWADPRAAEPVHAPANVDALRLAVALYDLGSSREERQRFADALARLPEMREAWLRRLVVALRRSGGEDSRDPNRRSHVDIW